MIDILIPHWNRSESLRRTLESLRSQSTPAARVVVCDNGSSDGTKEMLAGEFPDVCHLDLGQNLGFSAAVNRGLAVSSSELVVLLNNDVVADPQLLERVVVAREATGAEMVAACLRMPAGPIDSAGVEVDRSLVAYDVWHGRDYVAALGAAEAPTPLAPCAGAGAYDRSALESVGGFDEGFFAYLEDVDLGLRMRSQGMDCAVALDAFAWHVHSATLGSGSAAKNRLMGRSRGRLLWKHRELLSVGDRFRGGLIDAITYAGQGVIDHNLDAIRGRLEARRELGDAVRPSASAPDLARLRVRRSVAESLRLRLGRRRRVPVQSGRQRPSPPPDARG